MWQKIKNIYHFFVAILANIIFSFPGREMTVVGVTGTDGKTTTVNLIYHILIENGYPSSMLTSINANVAGRQLDTGFHVTTPSSMALQKILKKAFDAGSKYFILEVTSHALDQNRVWGIPFKIGVLTNVTSEHLDYHKTYKDYLKTKEKLLKLSKIAIVNRDDGSYALLPEAKKSKGSQEWITYGKGQNAGVNFINFPFESEFLIGDFNRHNALAAVAVCRKLGLKDEQIKKSIKTFRMPLGRLDFVYDEDFAIVIDFAHTPNAFNELLGTLRHYAKGRLIHIFGAAGKRDRAKRPYMGEISSKYADIIFLTAEDPRSEDVNKIIEEIASGIKKKDTKVLKIADRKEAIEAAIKMAKEGDLVAITGKGHEKSMTYGSKDYPWNEYSVVSDAIKKINPVRN